jgi:hypothetical protein
MNEQQTDQLQSDAACTLRPVRACKLVRFPLTPALTRREREKRSPRFRASAFIGHSSLVIRHSAALILVLLALTSAAEVSPRVLFNDGTAKLREGKLREAETLLQSVVAAQREPLQPPALYNLGHVRFQQGTNALAEAEKGDSLRARSGRAQASGSSAQAELSRAIELADVESLLGSYFAGRGARRELREATNAIHKALQQYGAALNRWQRASADFKSADELRASDDAQHNADVVDRHIAALIDEIAELQQMQQAMGQQRQDLREQMQQARGKLPEGMELPEGMSGDEEEDEEGGGDPQQEMAEQQAPSRDGQEMQISPEDAMRLLETLQLDSNRKLPIGADGKADPKSRSGKVW